MPIKSRMTSILGQIELEHPELFALEFGKIAESDFVYTLASTNIDYQNVLSMAQKATDEFYNGTNRTRTVRVVCP